MIELFRTAEASDPERAPLPLTEPPKINVEVRVIIWGCKNLKPPEGQDKVEAEVSTELTCEGYTPVGKYTKVQNTDVHQNCTDGVPEFNWRVLYPRIKVSDSKNCRLRFILLDHGLINSVPLGNVEIDIKKFIDKVSAKQEAIEPDKGFQTKLLFKTPDLENEGEDLVVGTLLMTLQIMTEMQAGTMECGLGRDEPNQFPELRTPASGRGWGDFFAGFSFGFAGAGLLKKVLPIVFFVLGALILLKWLGLL